MMMFWMKTTYLVIFVALSGSNTTVAGPVASPGCCSLDYKSCIDWCGNTKDSCLNCNHHNGVGWLENGPQQDCQKRWKGCENNKNDCCDGLVCRENKNDYMMCLPPKQGSTAKPTESPTTKPPRPPTPNFAKPCCSLDYRTCIDWCGPTYDSCASCNHHDGVGWLQNGPPAKQNTCLSRWTGCGSNVDGCCDGLVCKEDVNNYLMCMPKNPIGTNSPTASPMVPPTVPPTESRSDPPTDSPTVRTTEFPSESPTESSTETPTDSPSEAPTDSSTEASIDEPTGAPTDSLSGAPTELPADIPSIEPTNLPTPFLPFTKTPESDSPTPTMSMSLSPSPSLSIPSSPAPTPVGTVSNSPSLSFSSSPSPSTNSPTPSPTVAPTFLPTDLPTFFPTFYPTNYPSSEPTSTTECANDPTLMFKDDPTKNCYWVGKKADSRCSRKWNGKQLHEYCPVICETCPDGSNSPCVDDPAFFYKNESDKDCQWVGLNQEKFCSKKWDGVELRTFCPSACNSCPTTTKRNNGGDDNNNKNNNNDDSTIPPPRIDGSSRQLRGQA